MRTLRGVAAAPGAGVAPALVFRPDDYELPDGPVADPEKALLQLAEALDDVAARLEEMAQGATGAAREILEAQAAIARDRTLRDAAVPPIRSGEQPARAILRAGDRFARELEATGNEYLAARAPDVRHICDLAARALVHAPPRTPPRPAAPCVLVADDLTPADTTTLDPHIVRGIATVGGSRTSHTAVVARSLGIPAVVGARGLETIGDGEVVALDGFTGDVIVDPDAAAIERLLGKRDAEKERRERVRTAAGKGPTTTVDGRRIEIAANVRSVEELRAALREGAEGVGLLRTELLYVDREHPPTQEEQESLLREMHALLGDRKLIVRTFDIGADKAVPFLPVRPERNPELGVRGIRLAQVHPDLLDAQLRAVAATSALGPTAVMAPMVATLDEVHWFVERCVAAGIPAAVDIGVMVEIPSLALMAEELRHEIDFVSIGTNDLTQYLHAADRRHGALALLQDPFDPAVLRAVDLVCRGAYGHYRVGVCGEAAGDPRWAILAAGLGVEELSMQSVAIAESRATLQRVSYERCRVAAAQALCETDADAIRAIAKSVLKESS